MRDALRVSRPTFASQSVGSLISPAKGERTVSERAMLMPPLSTTGVKGKNH